MSSPGSSSSLGDSDDQLTLIMVGTGLVGTAGAIVLTGWAKVVALLISYNVLVPARQAPRISLPYSNGAGLDLPRIGVCIVVVVLALFLLVDAGRRRRARRLQEQQA